MAMATGLKGDTTNRIFNRDLPEELCTIISTSTKELIVATMLGAMVAGAAGSRILAVREILGMAFLRAIGLGEIDH